MTFDADTQPVGLCVTHELRCYTGFNAVCSGMKPFEILADDPYVAVGDVLWLRECNQDTDEYTGRECRLDITYVLRDAAVLKNAIVLGLRLRGRRSSDHLMVGGRTTVPGVMAGPAPGWAGSAWGSLGEEVFGDC